MAEPVRFRQYINALRANLEIGKSTEHTHRPAFKMLLESVRDGITATNEPGRIECGAPDFSIGRGVNRITVGYVEAKPESTEGGRRVSVLKRQEGAPVNLG